MPPSRQDRVNALVQACEAYYAMLRVRQGGPGSPGAGQFAEQIMDHPGLCRIALKLALAKATSD
jgi:hypothetical protein